MLTLEEVVRLTVGVRPEMVFFDVSIPAREEYLLVSCAFELFTSVYLPQT